MDSRSMLNEKKAWLSLIRPVNHGINPDHGAIFVCFPSSLCRFESLPLTLGPHTVGVFYTNQDFLIQ
jgi:hypothetical protein